MKGNVDFRRFRTWDAEPAMVSTPTWRILVRYGYIRLASSWPGRILLILLAVVVVAIVGGASYGFAGGVGVDAMAWSGVFVLFCFPLAAILLIVGSSLFADDIRFNAPLFYFSKPVSVGAYFRGKLAFLGSLVGAAVVAPILLLLLLALFVGVPAGAPPEAPWYHVNQQTDDQWREEWYATHVDSVGEWTLATVVTLPGMLLATTLFAALAVACSVYTRRGWHAGMAFVALVGGTSLAGGVLADSLRGASANLASPIGWAYLMVGMPMELLFARPGPRRPYEAEALAGAEFAIPLAYLLAAATTAGALWLSHLRLARQEGRL